MEMSEGKTLKLLRVFNKIPKSGVTALLDRFHKDSEMDSRELVDKIENDTISLDDSSDISADLADAILTYYAFLLRMEPETLARFLCASDKNYPYPDFRITIARMCLRWLYFCDKIGKVSENDD